MANLSMDCGLIRKVRKAVLVALVLFVIGYVLWAAFQISFTLQDPPEFVATEWVCETPYVRLSLGMNNPDNCELEYCGEIIPFDIGFLYDDYEVFPAGSVSGDSLLFSGEFRYSINKKKLIFTINHDYLFDGKYKKLVFTPVPGTEVTTK